MKGSLLFFVLLFAQVAPLSSGCAAATGDPKTKTLQAKAATYLVKDDTVRFNFAILDEGVATYASPADKAANRPECFLRWEDVPVFLHMVRALPASEALTHYLEKGEKPWNSSLQAQFGTPAPTGALPSNSPEAPLAGLRVALDPGHLGGDMDFAQDIEKKYVRIKRDSRKGVHEDIAFNEGNLALATALELRELLTAAGAEVLLTREKQGHCAFGYDFETWLELQEIAFETGNGPIGPDGFHIRKADDRATYRQLCAAANYIQQNNIHGTDSTWWMKNATRRNLYRIPFLKSDFERRAQKINAFQPDATLILHYNIYEKNDPDRQGYLSAVPQNYCMAFIPGSFMKGELDQPEQRMAFLAKLLSDDLSESESLCAAVLKEHVRQLGVPLKGYDPHLRYLGKASLPTAAKGVFARNLSMTRLVNGVMCFGESLYQDNIEEAHRLNAKDFVPAGMRSKVPFRVKEVAQAYFDGLVSWAKTR